MGSLHDWIISLDLPGSKTAAIENFLTDLGATKPLVLAGLEDDNVAGMTALISKLKISNFNKQLKI